VPVRVANLAFFKPDLEGSDYRYACPDAVPIKESVYQANCVDLMV